MTVVGKNVAEKRKGRDYDCGDYTRLIVMIVVIIYSPGCHDCGDDNTRLIIIVVMVILVMIVFA